MIMLLFFTQNMSSEPATSRPSLEEFFGELDELLKGMSAEPAKSRPSLERECAAAFEKQRRAALEEKRIAELDRQRILFRGRLDDF